MIEVLAFDNRMDQPKFALAAGVFAALGTAVTQLIEITVLDSHLANIAFEALFIGLIIYIGLKIIEPSEDPQ